MALDLDNLYCAMVTCRRPVTHVCIQSNQETLLFKSAAGLVCERHADELEHLNGLSMPLEVFVDRDLWRGTVGRGRVMGNIEHAAELGAAALVKNGVVVDHVTGDVLYDYDFTPIEAGRVVLEAVNYQGAVDLEAVIDVWAHDYANDDWHALTADEQLAVASRIVAAVRGQ